LFFRFLRQPSRPITPRPVAKRGRATRSGVVASEVALTPTHREWGKQNPLHKKPKAKQYQTFRHMNLKKFQELLPQIVLPSVIADTGALRAIG